MITRLAHYSARPDTGLCYSNRNTFFSISLSSPPLGYCLPFLLFPHSSLFLPPAFPLHLLFSSPSQCPGCLEIFRPSCSLLPFPSLTFGKQPSTAVVFLPHLELVAACHPIIADHPHHVSMSQSSQMIMTLPSCSLTRDTLGSSNPQSTVCVPMHVYFGVCKCYVFALILYVQKGHRKSRIFPLLLWFACANASMCFPSNSHLCMSLLVWIAWCDLECDLCPTPSNHPSHPINPPAPPKPL